MKICDIGDLNRYIFYIIIFCLVCMPVSTVIAIYLYWYYMCRTKART